MHSEEEDPANDGEKGEIAPKSEELSQPTRPMLGDGRPRRNGAVFRFAQALRDCLHLLSRPRCGVAVVELTSFRKVRKGKKERKGRGGKEAKEEEEGREGRKMKGQGGKERERTGRKTKEGKGGREGGN